MTDTADKSVAELLQSDDSPFSKCEKCGKPVVHDSHDCEKMNIFSGSLRREKREIIKEYDDHPPDEDVMFTTGYRATSYHKLNDDGKIVEGCNQRNRTDIEMTIDTRRVARDRYNRHPCPNCYDLPAEEIKERFEQL